METHRSLERPGRPRYALAAAARSVQSLEALRERIGAHGLGKSISHLRPSDRGRGLPTDATFVDGWQGFPDPWRDPCLLPLVSGDGDSLGVLVYPPAEEANLPPPIVFHERETDELCWVAESSTHLERMVAAIERSQDQAQVDAERGQQRPLIARALRTTNPNVGPERGEQERRLVRDLLSAGDERLFAHGVKFESAGVPPPRNYRVIHGMDALSDWLSTKSR